MSIPPSPVRRTGRAASRSRLHTPRIHSEDAMMRFMIIRKADPETEAGVKASEEVIEAMARYNEEMIDAGVMLGGDGLHPSSRGARIRFSGGRPTITHGPVNEAKGLIARSRPHPRGAP